MMGGDGTNIDGDLTELHWVQSVTMNQMMGRRHINFFHAEKVNIGLESISRWSMRMSVERILLISKRRFRRVSFHMKIGDLVDNVLMQLYPFDFARDLYQHLFRQLPWNRICLPDHLLRLQRRNDSATCTCTTTCTWPASMPQQQPDIIHILIGYLLRARCYTIWCSQCRM